MFLKFSSNILKTQMPSRYVALWDINITLWFIFLFIAIYFFQMCKFVLFDFPSRKHAYINLNPLNPLLHSKTGVYIRYTLFFLISAQNIDCEYLLELPRQSEFFSSENFWFFGGEIFYIFE